MAYVIPRTTKGGKQRFVAMYRAANGKIKSAGTFDTTERAMEIAEKEETHARGLLSETSPAEKATMTIEEFVNQRFIPRHNISRKGIQTYGYHLKNHVIPFIGHLPLSEVNRETFYNLLVKVLPSEDGGYTPLPTLRATRTALSSLCQMAWDEGYRDGNPIRSIKLPKVAAKPVLVANHSQWERLEEALPHQAAKLYARLNVTTWARQCEMVGFRPCDFEFDKQIINITRSTVYVTGKYHPSGVGGYLTRPNPKNGDWRRFAISAKMCAMVQDHIQEYNIADEDLLFPQWMFAWRRASTGSITLDNEEKLPPLVSASGKVYEHGTMGARFTMNCHCVYCRAYAAWYQRERNRRLRQETGPENWTRGSVWRKDGSEFLSAAVWARVWGAARDEVRLPEALTPYNARHTGISWAVAQNLDLGKIRQRAGHGSLDVLSRYTAILDEEDTSLADSLETIFDAFG